MIIIHHIDNDGYCSAAIVATSLSTFGSEEPLFIPYDHKDDIVIDFDNIASGQKVFIVDLAMNDHIMSIIDKLIREKDCKVVHIDHHHTSLTYFDDDIETSMNTYNKFLPTSNYTHMFDERFSASLLCWFYSCMTDDERKHPENVEYDVSEEFSHFYINTPTIEYRIPMVVRFIDDNDLFRNINESAKYFGLGFSLESDTKPSNKWLWEELLYATNEIKILKYVESGRTISKYIAIENSKRMNSAFERNMFGLRFLCLNETYGNSRIFGDKFDEYDAVIKFSYDGDIWRYTAYASAVNDPDNEIDLSIMAKQFGGGGHKHACGWSSKLNILDDTVVLPNIDLKVKPES